ncbi:Tat pathway signal sequence domain protein [Burkholderia plantarii]|uniref:exo-rhamnogalacturonan lyase family protein n=1 Tax=Burkholderia plantarii TaxID=41899 RepID=UPI00272D9632|nr:Tat pathway signal sequence domain protein [Burkholderia plantarii]WLE62883.1 Tat pathway signal sequence domain protein [Burkholderia plantarii]
MTRGVNRRTFFKSLSLAAGAVSMSRAGAAAPGALPGALPITSPGAAAPAPVVARLRWLDGETPAEFAGATWGTPWPPGAVPRDARFLLGDGAIELQSWPLATWPDGSLKWSAHALAADQLARLGEAGASGYALAPADAAPAASLAATPVAPIAIDTQEAIVVDTGLLRCTIAHRGDLLFRSLARRDGACLTDGRLILLAAPRDPVADRADGPPAARLPYPGRVTCARIESTGPARAVIRIDGTHAAGAHGAAAGFATLLPFTIRLEFHRGADTMRVTHSIVVDAPPDPVAIHGVGLRFSQALDGEPHQRFVRFVGADGGVFAEAVRGLTGLRRSPGRAIEDAQFAGHALPPASGLPERVADELRYVPAFGDYSLLQPNADGFTIDKRTAAGRGWIGAAAGRRASGTGYLGTARGGVAFGIRNFWQSHPAQLDIRDAHTDLATVTLWLWAPRADAMDLRAYHDGLGETDYAKQRDALDITYEDYEPGFNSPVGIARTSEIELQLFDATPSAARLAAVAARIQAPPRLVPSGAWLDQARAFDAYWRPAPAAATGAAARLGKQLDWLFAFYRDQVEQRRWYGFWHFGDVMHTYDETRHVWRYDVGGFAWDNGELSTDIWLWHLYLHTGRADVFRMAEAMTRHGSEVDVHHIGRFSPLGSRHDVQHWGDSAKQLRVSSVANHRFHYYLTADERLGDLLREQAGAVWRLRDVLPGRKIGETAPAVDPAHHATVSFGTDWGAVAAAWLTEWERTGEHAWRDRLVAGMESIAAQPHGFFTGAGAMDLRTGRFAIDTTGTISVSHLSAVFGLPEICSELLRSLPVPAFRDAWLQYCTLYSADADTQRAALGRALGPLNLSQGHARLLAYAGRETGSRELLRRAWAQFEAGRAGNRDADFESRRIGPPVVLNDVDDAPRVSTNSAAQWGLGAIGLLALGAVEP